MKKIAKFDDPKDQQLWLLKTETVLFCKLDVKISEFKIAVGKAIVQVREGTHNWGPMNLAKWRTKVGDAQETNLKAYNADKYPNPTDKKKIKDLILGGREILETFFVNSGDFIPATEVIHLRSMFTSCQTALEAYMPTPAPARSARQRRAFGVAKMGTCFPGSRSPSPPSRSDLCEMRRLVEEW